MRRFFRFLFRHEWVPTGEIRQSWEMHIMVRDRCKHCGLVSDWRYLLSREDFNSMYRMRGCPGK
jgi:hypothetical protein